MLASDGACSPSRTDARCVVRTIPFSATTDDQREQMAAVLVAAFSHMPSAWADFGAARAEVTSFLTDPARAAWVAVDAALSGAVLGWIGAIRHSRYAWELHPLAVHPGHHGRGVGTRLVRALEAAARAAGVLTVWLGTDDDFGGTTLYGADLYPDVLARLTRLAPAPDPPYRHPYSFYRRLGYAVVGVLPDVDGVGRHDILMAKRVADHGGGAATRAVGS